MEFLDGESLAARLARIGTLDTAEVADIAHDTASALQAAHDAGIVHRDLKPDNIFLAKADAGQRSSGRAVVKVLDFGIAKLAYPGSVSKTATGSILGTPLYMSPEQGRGLAKVDFRSDIYSLGCIIFEMVCGRPPFLREAPGDLIIAHSTEAPPWMSALVHGVSEDLERLVERLLEKAPDARPQSMAQVVAALRPIQRRSSTHTARRASGTHSNVRRARTKASTTSRLSVTTSTCGERDRSSSPLGAEKRMTLW
jgi:serine/threonine-protein kinase